MNNITIKAGRPSKDKSVQRLTELLQQQEQETTKFNFTLTREEHDRLKMHALKSRKTITQLLRDYIHTLPEY